MLTAGDLEDTDLLVRDDLRALVCAYAPRLPIRQIAVVGNAPLEESGERAGSIDASDLVIRCNSFALDEPGEPRCSGRRTHVVVVNGATRISPWLFAGYSDRLYLKSQPGAVYRRRATKPMPRLDLWPEDLGALTLPNRALISELRELIAAHTPSERADDIVVPTSGIISAWIAYRLFPEAALLLTGFSALVLEGRQDQWRHQWDTGVVPVSRLHLVDGEGNLMRQWVSEGRARHLP